MVSSRHRTSTATESSSVVKLPKPPLDEWTTKEKLCLASLAIKHGNAWNSVARNMQSFVEKDRPEGWSNQKTCAAQFDKLMNELGVDKRPKRNEPSDGNSSSVIYKKMAEKRVKELKDDIIELRKLYITAHNNLEALESSSSSSDKTTDQQLKQKTRSSSTTTTSISSSATVPTTSATTIPTSSSSSTTTNTAAASSSGKTPAKTTNASTSSTTLTPTSTDTSEKPPTRALTRRESSRQNLEKTLAVLCKEASDIQQMKLFTKPTQELERENYDKVILKHMDMSIIKKRLGGEVEDPYAVMNDLMLMFQNATMFYPPGHHIHKTAIDLREKLVPQWEKALLERFRSSKH